MAYSHNHRLQTDPAVDPPVPDMRDVVPSEPARRQFAASALLVLAEFPEWFDYVDREHIGAA